MNGEARIVSEYARGFGNFYTLWTLVALTDELPQAVTLAERYKAFMEKVNHLAQMEELDAFLREDEAGEYKLSFVYLTNSRGASTDLGPRAERLKSLMAATEKERMISLLKSERSKARILIPEEIELPAGLDRSSRANFEVSL
jgi:hypothetical protein